MSENKNESAPSPVSSVQLFTVKAFKDKGEPDEKALALALPRGFIPGEKERAESVAKRCNALNLVGVTFKAVEA